MKNELNGILSAPVNAGGFGRPLNALEMKRLRAAGMSCGKKWAVLQAYGRNDRGLLYRPASGGGLNSTGIILSAA
jgi:hypothetical protein